MLPSLLQTDWRKASREAIRALLVPEQDRSLIDNQSLMRDRKFNVEDPDSKCGFTDFTKG
jgi:hypothetical protein